MPILATSTIIYTPDNAGAIVICRRGDILEVPVELTPRVAIQTSQIVGAEWELQQARGNAAVVLTVTTATPQDTLAEAEARGQDTMIEMITHPIGVLDHYSCYQGETPMRATRWQATVAGIVPHPITSDHIYSSTAAWQAIAYQLTLTNPQLI